MTTSNHPKVAHLIATIPALSRAEADNAELENLADNFRNAAPPNAQRRLPTRRHLLAGAGALVLSTSGIQEAKANPVLIIPGIVTGLFGIWTVLRGEQLAREQHAQSMQMQALNARIAQQQIDAQREGIDVQLVLALIQAGQQLSPAVLARFPVLQNTAFDLRGARFTKGLTQNCDGNSTNLSVQAGDVAVSRAGFGGTLNPGETAGLAGVMQFTRESVVPIPVSDFQSVGDFKTERARELISTKRKTHAENISLIGSRLYTRAKRPGDGAVDMESYAIVDRSKRHNGSAAVEFEFIF